MWCLQHRLLTDSAAGGFMEDVIFLFNQFENNLERINVSQVWWSVYEMATGIQNLR